MAKAKKVLEPVVDEILAAEEAPAVTEEVTEEAPLAEAEEWTHAALAAKLEKPVEIKIELAEAPPEKTYAVTLVGRRGGRIQGQINGKPFSLPTGSEINITAQFYDAVKAYITSERN